jgi:putative hemolysin
LDPGPSTGPLLLVGLDSSTLLLLASLVLAAFCILAETSIRNFRWPRLHELLPPGPRRDRIERVLERERTILDGIITLRLISTFVFLFAVCGLFRPNSGLGAVADPEGFFRDMGVALLVYLGLLLGVVRGLARAVPERVLLVTLPGASAIAYAMLPLVLLTDGLGRLLGILMGRRPAEASEEARQEILDAVTEGEKDGAIDDEGREMIENIIEVQDQAVTTIMTPRTAVFAVDMDRPLAQVVRMIAEEGHSRVPVYSGSIDNIQGILYAKDLLRFFGRPEGELPAVKDVMRKPLFVPETKRTADLLEELRRDQVHMAVVIDEFGGMAGVVTIEDILEEIVGEIEDEYDPPGSEGRLPIVKVDGTTADVGGQVHVDELNEALSLALPESEGYETVGGFIATRLGRLPEPGEMCVIDRVQFEILEADARRIGRVRVKVPE